MQWLKRSRVWQEIRNELLARVDPNSSTAERLAFVKSYAMHYVLLVLVWTLVFGPITYTLSLLDRYGIADIPWAVRMLAGFIWMLPNPVILLLVANVNRQHGHRICATVALLVGLLILMMITWDWYHGRVDKMFQQFMNLS